MSSIFDMPFPSVFESWDRRFQRMEGEMEEEMACAFDDFDRGFSFARSDPFFSSPLLQSPFASAQPAICTSRRGSGGCVNKKGQSVTSTANTNTSVTPLLNNNSNTNTASTPSTAVAPVVDRLFGQWGDAAMSVEEDDNEVRVNTRVPSGFDNVKVAVDDDNMLTMSGEKSSKHETKDDQGRVTSSRQSWSSFSRSVLLPNGVDKASLTSANGDGGLWHVMLPKQARPSQPQPSQQQPQHQQPQQQPQQQQLQQQQPQQQQPQPLQS